MLSEQAGKTQHRERYDVIECDTACQRCRRKSPAENGTDTEQLFEGSPFATAADVDRDGAITQADYAIINDYLTNGEPINQAYNRDSLQ